MWAVWSDKTEILPSCNRVNTTVWIYQSLHIFMRLHRFIFRIFLLLKQLAMLYYLPISKVKLATVVEDDQKAPLSITTTPRCRGRRYSFPLIAPLYPWYVPHDAVLSKEVSSTIFKVFGLTQPGIEPRSPGPLASTLPTRPNSWIHTFSKSIPGIWKPNSLVHDLN